MKRTIYDTKKYILKDLKEKDEKIKFILSEFSNIAHTKNNMELKKVDEKFCEFYNYFDNIIK